MPPQSGRLLVGLRWWNEANDTGSAWRFESLPEGSRVINAREKRLFWSGLVANCGVWALFSMFAIFGLHGGYLVLTIIGLIMAGSNLIGYYKCSKEAKAQLSAMSGNLMTSAIKSRLGGMFG